MNITARTFLAIATLCATSAPVLQASAATIVRNYFSQAAANCQPALPTFDGSIRKRPKALANEGASNAFVTCAFERTNNVAASVKNIQVIAMNRASVSQDLTCTLVDGFMDVSFTAASTKTVTLPAGASNRAIWDFSADNAGSRYVFPAVSCNIRPGVEISGTTILFDEEIGT